VASTWLPEREPAVNDDTSLTPNAKTRVRSTHSLTLPLASRSLFRPDGINNCDCTASSFVKIPAFSCRVPRVVVLLHAIPPGRAARMPMAMTFCLRPATITRIRIRPVRTLCSTRTVCRCRLSCCGCPRLRRREVIPWGASAGSRLGGARCDGRARLLPLRGGSAVCLLLLPLWCDGRLRAEVRRGGGNVRRRAVAVFARGGVGGEGARRVLGGVTRGLGGAGVGVDVAGDVERGVGCRGEGEVCRR